MPSQAVLELMINLKDNASSGLASLGGAVGKLGMVAGGVALAGVAALGAAVVSGVGDAREAAKIYAQTENVIRSTGGAAGVSAQQVSDLAASLSAAAGKSLFGDDDIQQSTNLLLTFTNIKQSALEAATAISVDMAQALGGAPKDAAIQLGKALNDPIAGISALSRVGVSFTDQQKEQIKTMQEAGDMAGAQGIILAELNKEFGGSAQAAADADGGWAQFNDRLGEAKETLGVAVLPLLGMLVGVLNDSVIPIVEAGALAFGNLVNYFMAVADDGDRLNDFLANLPAFMQPVVELIGGLMVAFQVGSEEGGPVSGFINMLYSLEGVSPIFVMLGDGIVALSAAFSDGGLQGGIQFLIDKLAEISPGFALLKGAVEAALPPIQEIVLSVFGIITSFMQEHGATMLADVTSVWNSIQGLISAVLPPIQAIVAAVFGAIAQFLHDHGAEIQAFLAQTWDQIASIVKTAVALIQAIVVPVFTFIAGFIQDHGAEIQAILSAAWTVISTIITTVLSTIQGVIKAALQLIQGDWSGAWETIKQTCATIVEALLSILTTNLDLVKTLFGDMASDVIATLSALPGQAAALGRNIIDGIISGVRGAASSLYSTLSNMASSALQAAKDAIGIGSPSKDFADEVGNPIVTGIIQGIQNTTGSLVKTMTDLAAGLLSGTTDAIDQMSAAILDADTPDASFLGEGILNGIIDGMRSKLPSLTAIVNSTADTVVEAFQGALDISSPSQVMADAIGTPLIQGIAMGMTDALPGLIAVFEAVAEAEIASLALQTGVTAEQIQTDIEAMRDYIADLTKQAEGLGSLVSGAIASGFSAEGSIDRQIARNLDAMAKVGATSRRFAESQLATAQQMAAQFLDPATGAKYLKMRSDQIFELAKLQDSLNAATDADQRARIQQQITLITQAQVAEQNAFRAAEGNKASPVQKLIEQLQTLLLDARSSPTIGNSPIYDVFRSLLLQLQSGAGGFAPVAAPVVAAPASPGGNRGLPTIINNTFNLPTGTTQQLADEVMRRLNIQVAGRRS